MAFEKISEHTRQDYSGGVKRYCIVNGEKTDKDFNFVSVAIQYLWNLHRLHKILWF